MRGNSNGTGDRSTPRKRPKDFARLRFHTSGSIHTPAAFWRRSTPGLTHILCRNASSHTQSRLSCLEKERRAKGNYLLVPLRPSFSRMAPSSPTKMQSFGRAPTNHRQRNDDIYACALRGSTKAYTEFRTHMTAERSHPSLRVVGSSSDHGTTDH